MLICFLILIVNLVWKTNEEEAEIIVLLIFIIWRCFNRRWVRAGGVGAEGFTQGQIKSHPFPGGNLVKVRSMMHSQVGYFSGNGKFHG